MALHAKSIALFSVPYVKTKASAGTLHGLKGIQDLSLFIKWRPIQTKIGYGRLSLFGIAGVSIPLTNYVADFLPLSIGLHSKTASARIMVDYQRGNLFATGSATYVLRDNIKIDRTSYYTTELHLTNEVEMPDGTNYNFRASRIQESPVDSRSGSKQLDNSGWLRYHPKQYAFSQQQDECNNCWRKY